MVRGRIRGRCSQRRTVPSKGAVSAPRAPPGAGGGAGSGHGAGICGGHWPGRETVTAGDMHGGGGVTCEA